MVYTAGLVGELRVLEEDHHRDEGGGATAHAVEDGHQLGHRRHLHHAGHGHGDDHAPITMATRARIRLVVWWPKSASGLEKVATTATMAAPAARRLPLRACLGELSPFRAMMKQTAAAR